MQKNIKIDMDSFMRKMHAMYPNGTTYDEWVQQGLEAYKQMVTNPAGREIAIQARKDKIEAELLRLLDKGKPAVQITAPINHLTDPSSVAPSKDAPHFALRALHLSLLAKYAEPPRLEGLIAAVKAEQLRYGVPPSVFPSETHATSYPQ
jgi:hypothetical protein